MQKMSQRSVKVCGKAAEACASASPRVIVAPVARHCKTQAALHASTVTTSEVGTYRPYFLGGIEEGPDEVEQRESPHRPHPAHARDVDDVALTQDQVRHGEHHQVVRRPGESSHQS